MKFDQELKKEIAQGYWSRTLSTKDIEGKGIRIANVHRWVREFFGPGKRPPKQTTAQPAPAKAAGPPSIADLQSLSKRKIKRGPNGRYSEEVKDKVMPALLQMPVGEVSERTGINMATLYLWKQQANQSSQPALERANGRGGDLVVAPVTTEDRTTRSSKVEVALSPDSIGTQMESIRKGEGFVNIVKAVKELKAAYKAGMIEDYDEIDLRFLLGFRQLTGSPLRMRK